MSKPIGLWLPCPGVGHINRGYESFTTELYDVLKQSTDVEPVLLSGARDLSGRGHWLPCLHRTSWPARLVSRLPNFPSAGYSVEQLSFAIPLIARMRIQQPDVVLVSDRKVAIALWMARTVGLTDHVPLIFSNGAPHDPPYHFADIVQHLTPVTYRRALDAGECSNRHILLPYGFCFDHIRPETLKSRREAARKRFGIASDATVILSAGALSTSHKRMNYVIEEVASGFPDCVLLLVGQRTFETPAIERLGRERLGSERFRIATLAAHEMPDAFAAGDIFVLASLFEGFGRIVVEALGSGLPTLLHDSPIFHFVAGSEAHFGDFSHEGELRRLALECLNRGWPDKSRLEQSERIVQRYSWQSLLPHYIHMLQAAHRFRD